MHLSDITFGKEPKKLPEVINLYNMTKGGVDCADQMIETYSSKFATRRWPIALFCNVLDIAALNAYVLFEKLKMDGAGKEKRRLFIKRLGQVSVKNYRSTDDQTQLFPVWSQHDC